MPQSSLKRIMIVTAAVAGAGLYLRHAVKPVGVAFRTGRAVGLADRDQDIRTLIHAVGDLIRQQKTQEAAVGVFELATELAREAIIVASAALDEEKMEEAGDGTEDRRGNADRLPRMGERVEDGAPGAAAPVPSGTA